MPSGQKCGTANLEPNKPNMGAEFLEFANKPNMGALSLKIRISQIWGRISQIWGHIWRNFETMCPHIWLIRPHIWLIQILSECAPIFGLFAPIFGLFANSRNSAPIFGLFGSKFAASLFWPDGTTWYREINLPWGGGTLKCILSMQVCAHAGTTG